MSRFSKFIGAILGGITGSGLVAIASSFGWNLSEAAAVAIAGGLAAIGTLIAPKNATG